MQSAVAAPTPGFSAGMEDRPNGGKRYRKTVVGTVVQFPTETAARKAADALRIDINIQTPHAGSGPTTVDQLIEHFQLKEMPQDDHERRSYSTKAASSAT